MFEFLGLSITRFLQDCMLTYPYLHFAVDGYLNGLEIISMNTSKKKIVRVKVIINDTDISTTKIMRNKIVITFCTKFIYVIKNR